MLVDFEKFLERQDFIFLTESKQLWRVKVKNKGPNRRSPLYVIRDHCALLCV